MTASLDLLRSDKKIIFFILATLVLWSLSTCMAYMHQLSLGVVCYLKLGILFTGGMLFWTALIPALSKSVFRLKTSSLTKIQKTAVLIAGGIAVVGVNQFLIHGVINTVLNVFFGCEDLFSGVVNPIQNNFLAHTTIYGLVVVGSWKWPAVTQPKKDFLWIKTGNKEMKLHTSHILRIESDRNCIDIFTSEAKHVMYSSLKKFRDTYLDDRFVQIHRSAVVRKDQIVQVRKSRTGDGTVTLADGSEMKFSRNFREGLPV